MKGRGFSLMEMMVVMLIVAIVAAATAPMVSKKMLKSTSDTSPWIWTNVIDNSIAYNLNSADDTTASIGSVSRPNSKPRLYINTKSISNAAKRAPHISFGQDDSNLFHIKTTANSMFFSNMSTYSAVNSVVFGTTDALGSNAVGIGINARATSSNSIALGSNSDATASNSIAIGVLAEAISNNSVALGHNSLATAANSIAIGAGSNAAAVNALVVGRSANSTGAHSVVMGQQATSNSMSTVTIGMGANSAGSQSVTLGRDSRTGNVNAVAIGKSANASAGNSVAIGYETISDKLNAIAMGHDARAKAENSISIGVSSRANGDYYSLAIGPSSNAGASEAIALGWAANATNTNAIAIGSALVNESYNTVQATSQNSIAIGANTTATNKNSISIGKGARASGLNSVAFGRSANAVGSSSVAIGSEAQALKDNVITLGDSSSTVFIPGNLVVGGTSKLGINSGAKVYLRSRLVDSNYNWNTSQYGNEMLMQLMHHNYLVGTGSTALRMYVAFTDSQIHNGENNPNNLGVVTDGPNRDKINSVLTSDRRLKNVGEKFISGLAEIKKLEVFNYTFKNDSDKTPRVGVMAQDLQKILPKAVTKGEDGFLRIRVEDILYAMVNAIKELDNKIDDIFSQIKAIDELKKQNYEKDLLIQDLQKQNKEQQKELNMCKKSIARLEKHLGLN